MKGTRKMSPNERKKATGRLPNMFGLSEKPSFLKLTLRVGIILDLQKSLPR